MDTLFTELTEDLEKVRSLLADTLEGGPPFLHRLVQHFPLNGGRWLRPSLVLTAGTLRPRSEDDGDRRATPRGRKQRPRLFKAAAAIELIHAGSLLHDDVVDDARLRRHVPTINRLFGPREAVLLGDFFLARAFSLVLELRTRRATKSVARLLSAMIEGELSELSHAENLPFTEADVLRIVELKTGSLFAEACYLGGLLAELPDPTLDLLRTFGFEAGYAYQLTDDLFDATSGQDQLGKDAGNDLRHGVPTLPLLVALELASPTIRRGYADRHPAALTDVAALLLDDRVRERCLTVARTATARAVAALDSFAETPGRKALEDFAQFASERAARS